MDMDKAAAQFTRESDEFRHANARPGRFSSRFAPCLSTLLILEALPHQGDVPQQTERRLDAAAALSNLKMRIAASFCLPKSQDVPDSCNL
jgi:hypothetical protein